MRFLSWRFNNNKEGKNRTTAFLIILFDVSRKLPLCTMDLLSKRPCQNKTPCWLGSCVQQDDRGSLENMTTSHSTLGPKLFWSFFSQFYSQPRKRNNSRMRVTFGILKSQCSAKGSKIEASLWPRPMLSGMTYNSISKVSYRKKYLMWWNCLGDHPFKTTVICRVGVVKNWSNLPTNSSKKLPAAGG